MARTQSAYAGQLSQLESSFVSVCGTAVSAAGCSAARRAARLCREARACSWSRWAQVADRDAAIAGATRRQYEELCAACPTPTYLTYGNVDVPTVWPDFARDGVHVLDGGTGSNVVIQSAVLGQFRASSFAPAGE